jgi:hypothetical protein
MSPGNDVNIFRPPLLKSKANPPKFGGIYNPAKTAAGGRDLVILAKHAAEVTAADKDGSRTASRSVFSGAGKGRFFSPVN